MSVDAAGSPRAYHLTNDKLVLDFNANGFLCCVAKVDGKAVNQSAADPAPGFFTSMTSLADPTKKESAFLRYFNSKLIPYSVLPPKL